MGNHYKLIPVRRLHLCSNHLHILCIHNIYRHYPFCSSLSGGSIHSSHSNLRRSRKSVIRSCFVQIACPKSTPFIGSAVIRKWGQSLQSIGFLLRRLFIALLKTTFIAFIRAIVFAKPMKIKLLCVEFLHFAIITLAHDSPILRRLPAHMSTSQSCSTHRAEIDIEAIHKTGVIFIENLDISAPLQTDNNSRFCLFHNVQIFSRCSVRITAKFATSHASPSFGGCGKYGTHFQVTPLTAFCIVFFDTPYLSASS